jgi:16S rRNA (guanine(966)-N(2))-methyltransferase RsmD
MDRMRESLFQILGPVEGLSFLDLFSGSGIVGIEAASRGCEPVIIVEKDGRKRKTILSNIAMVESIIKPVFMPAERFIEQTTEKFDLIFVDPPFRYKYKAELLERIAGKNLLAPGGLLMIHYPGKEKLPPQVESEKRALEKTDTRKYGGSLLSFYTAAEIKPDGPA